MKIIKPTRPATWLAVAAVALSASAADAALVYVNISDGAYSFADGDFTAAFGADVGIDHSIGGKDYSDAFAQTGDINLMDGSSFGPMIAHEYVPSFWPYFTGDGTAGSVSHANDGHLVALEGLLGVSLNLTGGGSADGWLVAFNDDESWGGAGVTAFIFNDEDLSDRDGAGVADLSDFNAGNYTEVDSVALAVPEPSSISLLALGAAGVMARRRRKVAA